MNRKLSAVLMTILVQGCMNYAEAATESKHVPLYLPSGKHQKISHDDWDVKQIGYRQCGFLISKRHCEAAETLDREALDIELDNLIEIDPSHPAFDLSVCSAAQDKEALEQLNGTSPASPSSFTSSKCVVMNLKKEARSFLIVKGSRPRNPQRDDQIYHISGVFSLDASGKIQLKQKFTSSFGNELRSICDYDRDGRPEIILTEPDESQRILHVLKIGDQTNEIIELHSFVEDSACSC